VKRKTYKGRILENVGVSWFLITPSKEDPRKIGRYLGTSEASAKRYIDQLPRSKSE